MKRLLLVAIGLVWLVATAALLTYSQEHPILWKWVTFNARSVGKPIQAVIYTDGKLNERVRVFATDQYWLLYFDDTSLASQVICVHQHYVGTPVAATKKEYDYFWGRLFQSETGGKFVPFNDGLKRENSFDPRLTRNKNETSFNISSAYNQFHFRSVKIELTGHN